MTHASHFDGDTLTLTSPRGTLVLSQGQCASIVIMAEKYGPVGRVREAHRPAEVCKLCGGTYEECQHKRCYGFVNGDRKPAAQGDEDKLRAWSIGYEYYYDAYFGPDAPFGNQQPTAATLAEVLQNGARLVPQAMMSKDAEIASLREHLAEAEQAIQNEKHGKMLAMKANDPLIRERDAARAEAEAAKQEAAGLRARKVKLPPSRVPLTDPQGHGDPYANGYSWGLLDCAAAIRAAGVEVEG